MSLNSYPTLARIVASCVRVSQKSADILREVKRSGDLNVKEKGVNDFVTKADFLSQLNIVKSLERHFPRLDFCGEEEGLVYDEYKEFEASFDETVLKIAGAQNALPQEYTALEDKDLSIFIDPLDGTREYTQGDDESEMVTVLIGITWKGKPIAGVVNQPFFKQSGTGGDKGRYLWGIVGVGAYDSISGKLEVPTIKDPSVIRVVTTRSHMTDKVKECLNNIPNAVISHAGGAGYKVLEVIEGKADCYIYPRDGTKRWDTCAPEAILRALNGKLTDVLGNEYVYEVKDINSGLVNNSTGILATINNDTLHNTVLHSITDQVKEDIKPKN